MLFIPFILSSFYLSIYFPGFFLFSLPLCMSCVCMYILFTLLLIQSDTQLSVNQDSVDPLFVAGSPSVQAVTEPSITPHIGSMDTSLPSSYTTPSSTPLPLELHIDEDCCSGSTSAPGSSVVIASSKSLQFYQKNDGGTVTSEISHVDMSVTEVCTSKVSKPLGESLSPVTVGRSSSPGPASRTSSPVIVSKNLNTVSKNLSPVLRTKSPISPDTKPENLVLKSHSPQAARKSPVTVPSTVRTVLKSASPVTVPRLSSPVPKSASPVTVSNISSPVTIPKCASPVMVPKLSSPVPRLSSPVTVPKSEIGVPKSPAQVIRKTYTVPGASSPRASPVSLTAVPSNSRYTPSTENQGGEVLDLTWPCREPFLDDALDKLLAPDSTRLGENQPPVSITPGDEDRSWEEEDGIYPEFSREGTLTPMTESSWVDECFTPSTCPGTPDALLDLPSQQPSAVERLSASGQVGGSA